MPEDDSTNRRGADAPRSARDADIRSERRARLHAKVVLLEGKIPGYLRDLSGQGCRITLLRPAPLRRNDRVTLRVLPGEESAIPSFSISLEVLWTRADPVYFFLGGRVRPLAGASDLAPLEKLRAYYEATEGGEPGGIRSVQE